MMLSKVLLPPPIRCKGTKYFYDSVTLDKTEAEEDKASDFPSIRSSSTFQEKLNFFPFLVTRIKEFKTKRENPWKFPYFFCQVISRIIHSQISLKRLLLNFCFPHIFLPTWNDEHFAVHFLLFKPQTWQFINFLYVLENERSFIFENPLIPSHQEKQIFALLRPLKKR